MLNVVVPGCSHLCQSPFLIDHLFICNEPGPSLEDPAFGMNSCMANIQNIFIQLRFFLT